MCKNQSGSLLYVPLPQVSTPQSLEPEVRINKEAKNRSVSPLSLVTYGSGSDVASVHRPCFRCFSRLAARLGAALDMERRSLGFLVMLAKRDRYKKTLFISFTNTIATLSHVDLECGKYCLQDNSV